MTVTDLLADPPTLHTDSGGRLIASLRLAEPELRFLDHHVRAGMKTIETGSGLSTVLFALKGARHTCITPDASEGTRIRAYCEQRAISHAGVTFIAERSEYALPSLHDSGFDLALIDGRHGFPAPFLDWFYLAERLRVGGIMMIDDLHIWTADVLTQFLCAERGWRLIAETGRAATFEKVDDRAQWSEWTDQPYVVRRSRPTSVRAKAAYVIRALRRGDWRPVTRLFR